MTALAELGRDARSGSPGQRAASSLADFPSRTPWPALVTLLASCGVLALVVWDVSGILRAVSVLGYLAVAPGLACARLIRIPDGSSQFVVGVALSLALGVLVAQGMIHLNRWSPVLGLVTLTTIASLAALIEVGRDMLTSAGGGKLCRRQTAAGFAGTWRWLLGGSTSLGLDGGIASSGRYRPCGSWGCPCAGRNVVRSGRPSCGCASAGAGGVPDGNGRPSGAAAAGWTSGPTTG